MRLDQRYKRDKEIIAKLVMLGASCREAAKELDVPKTTAWKLLNKYYDELGSLNDSKAEKLRKEFLTDFQNGMRSSKKNLMRIMNDPNSTSQIKLNAINSYSTNLKTEMEVLTRLRILNPQQLEITKEEFDVAAEYEKILQERALEQAAEE